MRFIDGFHSSGEPVREHESGADTVSVQELIENPHVDTSTSVAVDACQQIQEKY